MILHRRLFVRRLIRKSPRARKWGILLNQNELLGKKMLLLGKRTIFRYNRTYVGYCLLEVLIIRSLLRTMEEIGVLRLPSQRLLIIIFWQIIKGRMCRWRNRQRMALVTGPKEMRQMILIFEMNVIVRKIYRKRIRTPILAW